MSNFSPVFIAASAADVDLAEELLKAEGIEYEVRPEALLNAASGAACLQGLLFEVRTGQADDCRRLFRSRGLARGVVDA